MNSAKTAFLGSALLLGILCYLLYREARQTSGATDAAIVVYCAEALRFPAEDIAKDYQNETGQKIELRLGASQSILTSLQLTRGDLFLPADDSYIALAREKDLVVETLPLAKMQAVVITRPGLSPPIKTWSDLVQPGRKLGLANPEAAAISKLARSQLQKTGRWDEIMKLNPTFMGNINEVGNAVQLGTVDAGLVFDAVAGHFSKATVVRLPELDGVAAQIQVAVARSSTQPTEALRFARYLAAKDKGLLHLQKHGFNVTEDADLWADGTPHLVVFAGAMLRPAIEETLIEFERREGVRLTRNYNGCGILVGSMKTGQRPDLYFACDVQFMKQVQELYREPATVSTNQLVIAVQKGNPHQIRELKDLGRTKLRLGVGHEQQCALGQLTKETFLTAGLYGQLVKNVKVESPTGDLLAVKLRAGALDAAVVYQSNVTPYADLEAVPIKDIECSIAEQPVAQGKDTEHPQLTRRLLEALRTPESRRRFQELGFGWGPKQ